VNESGLAPLERLRRWDERRPSLPGEHWLTGALGLYLLLRPRRSAFGRLASGAAGALLITRALTGRDGAIAALKRLPDERNEAPEYFDVAAPWPYTRRVRITVPRRARGSPEARQRVDEPAAATIPA